MRSDLVTAAYVSDLSELIETCRPTLWVHGHLHRSVDYRVKDTRIICNTHGYGYENRQFNPTLVVASVPDWACLFAPAAHYHRFRIDTNEPTDDHINHFVACSIVPRSNGT
ncbi:hypothetical protein [Bradyrhizobium sp. S3.2.12]|uniref:hypothetical protein n=1 Tax=Bradyrhizobium sp. S3.2.12 TaxID=3156387 RepID=UPI0033969F83